MFRFRIATSLVAWLAGIPPAAALRSGAIDGARALGLANRLGTLEAGKLADRFIVRGNPVEDIRNTRYVRTVIKAGARYDAARLPDPVRGRLGPAAAGKAPTWRGTTRYAAAAPNPNGSR